MLKPIENYEGLYSVTPDGRVWSHAKKHSRDKFLRKGRWLKPYVFSKNRGYLKINLYKNGKMITHSIHQLVAREYIPNPLNKPQVNHLNGITDDNHVSNLSWVTNQENSDHAWGNGFFDNRDLKGEKNGSSKLTWQQIKEIRENHNKIEPYKIKIWEKYNISNSQYYNIIGNKSWKIEEINN